VLTLKAAAVKDSRQMPFTASLCHFKKVEILYSVGFVVTEFNKGQCRTVAVLCRHCCQSCV